MEYTYDAETDILVIRLNDRAPDHGQQQDEAIMHYAADGTLVEIEILDASTNAADMVRTMLTRAEA